MSSAARAMPAPAELAAQLVVVEQRARSRRRSRRRRRAGTSSAASPHDLLERGAGRPRRSARRVPSPRARGGRSPRTRDARQHAAGAAVQRVERPPTAARRARARTGRSSPVTSPQPRRPTTTSSSVAAGRGGAARPHRTIVGRSLRGSTVPTVSTYGGSTPARATVRVDLVVGRAAAAGRRRAARRATRFGLEAFADRARRG